MGVENLDLCPKISYKNIMPVSSGIHWRKAMTQTVMTLGQLFQYKINGFVQLDLFPEELEQAKNEQYYEDWLAIVAIEEGKAS